MTGYLWAVRRDDRGWKNPAPPGVVFHYRPGRKGECVHDLFTRQANGHLDKDIDALMPWAHAVAPRPSE